jgi:alkanesulfonate monooxygenase SsuD/methylene tetrahydromethanopterin reductase-like flavin-dependent oxidoreductase (luciferase family)
MTELAYAISSEEHDARSIVDIAKRAEAAGFRSVWVSDHSTRSSTGKVRRRSCGRPSARSAPRRGRASPPG